MARIVGKPNADDVKRVAVAALVAALDDGKDQARKKPGLTGMRAVATGAVLYTAGKAAFNGRRFINERLEARADQDGNDEDLEEDEELEDEPVAEEDEDLEEQEDEELEDEPVAEEDEDFEEDDEPVAEEDEDFEEDDEDEERSAASEPPVHPDEDDDEIDDADLPERPSRTRTPVGRR